MSGVVSLIATGNQREGVETVGIEWVYERETIGARLAQQQMLKLNL